jgi:hypothetical protein
MSNATGHRSVHRKTSALVVIEDDELRLALCTLVDDETREITSTSSALEMYIPCTNHVGRPFDVALLSICWGSPTHLDVVAPLFTTPALRDATVLLLTTGRRLDPSLLPNWGVARDVRVVQIPEELETIESVVAAANSPLANSSLASVHADCRPVRAGADIVQMGAA